MDEGFKKRLKQQARHFGFDLAGVTTADPPPHFEVFLAWLSAKRHGTMAYLESERSLERRADPRRIMPDCRSILVLAARYSPPPVDEPEVGVAAYARGEDYHDVFAERVGELAVWIEYQAGRPVAHRFYSDTGSLLERELAQRAGLGWIAKNTCLIHPRMGSYLLLAEMLLDLELPPDAPFEQDRCGSCQRCIEACPTGCILPDRTLDARRCISYLTIEFEGDIPRELRPSVGNWTFGCDACQRVCPWNARFARGTQDPAFRPRPFLEKPGLQQFLDLQPQTYQDLLRGSPLKRAKLQGLLRNAATVAGNQADPRRVPGLARILLGNEHASTRIHAAWALGCVGGEDAERALRAALETEGDGGVREEIRLALEGFA